jgi:hypothetical protein
VAANPIDVQKALKGADYPATKEDLVALARDNGADDEVVGALEGAETDEFSGPDEVMKALSFGGF